MTAAVIKSADAGVVRLVPLGTAPPVSRSNTDRERLYARIECLQSEVHRLTDALQACEAGIPQAREAGRLEGRDEGLQAARQDDAGRLAALEGALADGAAEIRTKLSVIEEATALLCRDCLDILLGDGRHRAAALKKIIRLQVSRLESALVLRVEVSASDFPDVAARAELARQNGLPADTVTALSELPPGSCLMRLRLGELDIGLAQQWSVLRRTLEQLSAEPDK